VWFARILSGCSGKTHGQGRGIQSQWGDGERTGLKDFLDVIEDEVQELVETLEHAGHCDEIDHLEHLLIARDGVAAHTFSAACELDPDPFVHVFGEIQDRLAFWFVHRRLWSLRAMVPATASG
jgi:hypothetical protein